MSEALFKRGTMVLFDHGITASGNFVTLMLLARYLSIKDFGWYSLGFTTAVSLGFVSVSFIHTPMSVLTQKFPVPEKMRRVTANFLFQLLIVATMCCLMTLVLLYCRGKGGIPFHVIPVYLFMMFSYLVQDFFRMVYFTCSVIKPLLLTDALSNTARIAAVCVANGMGVLDIHSALLISGSSFAVSALLGEIYWRLRPSLDLSVLKVVLVENFHYGKWMVGEALMYFFSSQVYLYLAASLLGVQAVAAISACQALLNSTNFIMNGMGNFVVPLASKKFNEGGFAAMAATIRNLSASFLLIVTAVIALVTLFRKELLVLVYKTKYLEYSYLIPLMALQFVADLFTRPFFIAFRAANLPNYGFLFKSISFIFTLIFSYPLITAFGLPGVVVGQILTFSIWLGSSVVCYLRLSARLQAEPTAAP